MLPLLNHINFSVCGFASVLGFGAGLSSLKVAPKASGLYHHLEASSKDGPIGAIGFKVGDTNRKVHNSRHNVVRTILATMTRENHGSGDLYRPAGWVGVGTDAGGNSPTHQNPMPAERVGMG